MIKFGRVKETAILDPIRLASGKELSLKIEILWKQNEGHYYAIIYQQKAINSEMVYVLDNTVIPNISGQKFYNVEACLGAVMNLLDGRLAS